jgi:6-phosphogluconolactonase
MKFSKSSQLFLVSAIGLLVATLLSACQLVTIDYVFLASSAATSTSSDGLIDILAVDSQSGAIRTAANAVSSGGVTPVALAVSPDYENLYVAHSGDNTVVHFAIASNGVLTSKDTVTLNDAPVSLVVSADGKYLYVAYGTTSAHLAEYALSSGAIGTLTQDVALVISGSESDAMVPTGVAVLQNNGGVYVSAYDQSSYNPGGTTTSSTHPGWVFGFAVSNGVLTASTNSPYQAGVKPTGLVADLTNRYVYVIDYASDQLIGYSITNTTTLSYMLSGPFTTSSEPQAIAIDPRGKFLYVANALDSTVSAYVINLTTGVPTSAVNTTGSSTNTTDTQPVAIAVDPALGRYVYTANYLGNSISGFRLDPTAGTLTQSQSTPYPTDANPTAIAIVPHGNHSVQQIVD